MEARTSNERGERRAEEVHPLICSRWSPREFRDRAVEPEKLRTLFEAARWAPSSFNAQPWRFLVATRDEPEWLERLQGYLNPGNAWAREAPVLVASAYATRLEGKNRPNRMAFRDLGAAEENMFLQAFALGLAMHQMAGFDYRRLKDELLPDGFEPGTMAAIGYPVEPTGAGGSEDGDRRPRKRRPLDSFVFGPTWGQPSVLVE